jgi:hypothetical protein
MTIANRVMQWMRSRGPLARALAVDVVGLAGAAAVINGVRLVHAPSAWIVAGVALVAWAVLKGGRVAS